MFEKIRLLLFDPVLHHPAGTAHFFVELLRGNLRTTKVGHNKPWIRFPDPSRCYFPLAVRNLPIHEILAGSYPEGLKQVACALSGKRFPTVFFVDAILAGRIELPAHRRLQRVTSQLIVIDPILVAQAYPDGPLGYRISHLMLHKSLISKIDKTG